MAVDVATDSVLLAGEPVASVQDYLALGGGRALTVALGRWPYEVVDEVKRSGLRGRGGAGFPTGLKWEAIRSHPCPTTYVVCNAAEGEPGTFKDRWILRRNPYQVLEGLAIAAHAVGAERAFIAIKEPFLEERRALDRALGEMAELDMLGGVRPEVVVGPDEYLFGEEKALLEVIEGNEPLPRILPPYVVGLFASSGSANPTATNNVETLACVPHIVRRGAGWFRSIGTAASPGTMVFTLSGDVESPGLYELPLGRTLRSLVEDIGGGAPDGRSVKAVFPGASHAVISAAGLDTPMDFDSMRETGSGLGSGGFVVVDDSACMVRATLAFCRFLSIESCAQCPACKDGSGEMVERLERIDRGEGSPEDLQGLVAAGRKVTGGARCYLPTGAARLLGSVLDLFGAEFEEHLGWPCPRPRDLPVPKLVDFDERGRRFVYDEEYRRKLPDWSYAEARSA
jgi:NADH:ubiquinone oxidoreductase subunit F (NADH-binding)